MVIDCHVHVSAVTGGRGVMSSKLVDSAPFRFMRWRLGIKGEGQQQDDELQATLVETIAGAKPVETAAVLAFDAIYTEDGLRDDARTQFYVANDYVIDLAARHDSILFGASVHPYRKDAAAEIERCANAGAVLIKWLPIVQGMNPASELCIPAYEAMAHFRLPLLCHTGGERTLPRVDDALADPALLDLAVQRGVTVIAAHCGTKSWPGEPDFVHAWARLAREHEHFYGDTSALNIPSRSYAWNTILDDPALRSKLVHGSDWPIIALPPVKRLGLANSVGLLKEKNWMRRDCDIKLRLGLTEDEYWLRASKILRLPRQ